MLYFFFAKMFLTLLVKKLQGFEFRVSGAFDNLTEENKRDKDESKKPT